MNKQKYIAILLTVVMLLSALPLDYIFAHEGYDPTKWVTFKFNPDDDYQYVEFNTEATAGTGTTFRTIGWNVKFRKDSISAWREVYVPVEPDYALNLNYKLYLSESGYEKNITDISKERVQHSIEYYVNSVDKGIYKEVQYYGGEWQFDARIQVYVNNIPQPGKVANTFEEALALASWGANTRNDFHTDYYERPGISKPEPIAKPDFNILYKGSIVNGKTVEKDMEDLKIILQDKSTIPSIANPIEKRTWYYWNVASGWTQITDTGENDTTVTINNCDSDLPGSKPLKKAFRLDVTDSYGYVYSASGTCYEVSFTVTTGTINVHYTNADTGSSVFPDETINNVPFNTPKTITNTKPVPEGLNLLNPSPQSATLTASNPIADVYFLYAPIPPEGGEQSIITVYYKDKVTKLDISQPDIIIGDYGTYQAEAIEITGYTLDSTTPSPVTVTTSVANSKPEVIFLYNASAPKCPPVAIIDAPEMVYAGDNFRVSGKNSYDPDGSITDYIWDYDNDITGNTLGNKDSGYIWIPYGSSGLIKLQVTDNDGSTGSDREYVDVIPPVPIAKIDATGIPKVNRKLTVSAMNSIGQDHYPIDHTRDKWTITADSSILKYDGTLTDPTKELLAKAPGNLPATLQVNNTCIDEAHPNGFSDTDNIIIKILPDLRPNANFSVPAVVTRNPNDSSNATITVTNTSSSPDDDIIGKAVLMYAYDSDNDGNFEEETWYYSKDGVNWLPVGMVYADMVVNFNIFNVSTSNPSNFILKTNQVGKYRFEMRVMEDIPASQTISSFITENDYMRNDTFTSKPIAEKIVEVRNVAPSVSFQAKKNIPMDLVILTDYLGDKFDSLASYTNAKKAEWLPLGINPSITYVTDRKNVGDRTVYQYEWKRFIRINVDGWASDIRGDFPYHNSFTIELETLKFFEGEENFPDRLKNSYNISYSTYCIDGKDKDPIWYLDVYCYEYYDGQSMKTNTDTFKLGQGQCFNGLGTWFDQTDKDHLDDLIITVDQTYANNFKKCEQVGSERRLFRGLDVDKVMNLDTPSNNRYLLVAADSFWNTIENNKLLQDNIKSRNISSYLVTDNDTLNKVFKLSNFSDIRFINGLRAYEKYGKLYQYPGTVLQELPYTERVYPSPQKSVSVPMHELTIHNTITDNMYTTTISIINNSITVNGKVLGNVKSLYEIGDFYFAELFNGDIYYFKRYLSTYARSGRSEVYLYYNTYISNFVQLSGAKGIKAMKMIPALEYVDTGDIYSPKKYLDAEYFYIQDNNNNVYVAKSRGFYQSSGYGIDGDTVYFNYSDPTAVSDPAFVKSGVIDYNLATTRVQDHYYDTWNNYRTVDRDVVNVEYALTSELSSVLKADKDVNIYSTKELTPLKNLFDGIKGGIYTAGGYQAALDDIAKDIKATTSMLTNYYLVNEQINYSSIYSDYEHDPQYGSRWWFTHDADWFDNSNGVEPNAGKYITVPINPFTKAGKYEITLQVRDNPQNDARFDNYRLWSKVMDKLVVYVHRKPIALQRLTVANNGNGTYTVKAYDAGSYDPDYVVSRTDKGITAREWRWKELTSTAWTAGQMNKTDCSPDKSYITQLRVKDLEGVWSDYNTITIDKDNPPVALFSIDKKIINTTEYLKVKDLSFPQSFSPITKWHWIVKKLNKDGSVPSTNIQDDKFSDSNTGTGAMTGYDVNVKTHYADKGAGKYRIYLRVMNGNGIWSDGGTESSYNLNNFFHSDFEVQESFKISKFRVAKIRDLHLEPYYYYENGSNYGYKDKPFYVNDMAIDPSNFKVAGISLVPGFVSLTKGYRFEFEIDTTNFNEANDTIVVTPSFFTYTRGVPGVRGQDPADLYWEDSDKKVYKAGEGAHKRWAVITLDSSNRTITGTNSATWRGEYFIPATSWLVPQDTSAANAKSKKINADIIVNFSIKGYKDGVMKYDYNLQQWSFERTIEKYPYKIGDVIRYDYTKSSLDDKKTIINRP